MSTNCLFVGTGGMPLKLYTTMAAAAGVGERETRWRSQAAKKRRQTDERGRETSDSCKTRKLGASAELLRLRVRKI
jgi:hypothetical protein